MAIFRNTDTITLSMLDFLRLVQPELDTKPGSVARELFVDAPAAELAKLYVELRNISNLQSFASAKGLDLDRLARNFGLVRGSGSSSTGVVVFTSASLDSDISIPANTIVTARNGFTFKTLASTSMSANSKNVFKANAIRLRSDLDLAGITDVYAVEVAAEATNPGASGNVAKFSVVSHNVAGISNVSNLQSFTGGTSSETDDAFRSRVLAVFAGSNTGTALGYINALLKDQRIQDILTVEPGDPLMVRDGTDVITNSDGEKVIISLGTGGKVDIYIQGKALEQFTESFIYRDQSGKNDPTDARNDFVLGQRGVSSLLDFQQRRRQALADGEIPFQPVDEIISLSGSLSGPNFTQATTNAAGNLVGSFELVKDAAAFGGSAFGFDKIHFLSGVVSLEDEAIGKGPLNSQDAFDFTDVQVINKINQSIVLSNEIAAVSSSNRSLLTVSHTPIISIDRVFNLTTGERYIVSDANPNGDGDENTSGVFQISGNTLPTSTDLVQVSYVWNHIFDEFIDYDSLVDSNLFRTVQDSIDWGFGNRVVAEQHEVVYSNDDGYHILVDHTISRVVNVNTITVEEAVVAAGKIVVIDAILNIVSVLDNEGKEVFYTAARDGSFSGREITLPTDSLISNGDTATVRYNSEDIYSPDGYDTGTFNGQVIRFADNTISLGATVYADYIVDNDVILSSIPIINLPITGSQNNFNVSGNTVGLQPVTNIWLDDAIISNLRFAPSFLKITAQGIPSRGRLTIQGTTFVRFDDIITVRSDGLTLDLTESIESLSGSLFSDNAYVAFVAEMERVTVSNSEIASVDYEFDILNYELSTVDYSYGKAMLNSDLDRFEIKLQATADNVDNNPTTGQKIKITYYIADPDFTENITITSSDNFYSKYRYAFISSISIASGFTTLAGAISGTLNVFLANQPTSGSQYFAAYSYTAPKEGERITISYNYNRLISDATLNLEKVRPITADVLVRAATSIDVDISLKIVPTPEFVNNTTNLQQNVSDAVVNLLTSGGLEPIVDASDVVNTAYSITGVDRVIVTLFNKSGQSGIQKTLQAGRNEFFSAGTITIVIESR